MILGVGNDIIDIRRIEKTLERYGERFLARVFTDIERAQIGGAAPAGRLLRQALCRQGGLRQGAGHRAAPRRLLARHGRRQSALGPPNPDANRWSGKALRSELTPDGCEARIDLTITDDFPLAAAIVIISGDPGEGRPALTEQARHS